MMRVVTEPQSSEQITALMQEPGGSTLLIEQDGRVAAVVLTPERFERVRALELEEFKRLCRAISEEAIANGMTEEILAEILAEAKAERSALV